MLFQNNINNMLPMLFQNNIKMTPNIIHEAEKCSLKFDSKHKVDCVEAISQIEILIFNFFYQFTFCQFKSIFQHHLSKHVKQLHSFFQAESIKGHFTSIKIAQDLLHYNFLTRDLDI